MTRLTLLAFCGLGLAISIYSSSLGAEEGFVPLFDGKSLAGWEGKESAFRVEDGAIVAGSLQAKVPNNEFLCSTKEYGDFELRLKARLVGPGKNAGVQFRSQRIPNHHEVIGYQCDMGLADGKSIWGALYDESRRKKFLALGDAAKLAETVKADDWNDLVVRCEGPRIQIWVNGLATVDYTEAEDGIARRGIIGLQIHGGEPAEASYKDIRIKQLQEAAMPQPRFLYFDMGNVLLFFSHERMAAQMAQVAGITPQRAWQIVFGSDLNDRFERGQLTDRQFYEEFCAAAATRPDYHALLAAANDIFWLNAPMVALTGHLNAAGYRLGILSNTNEAHFAYVLDRFSYLRTLFAVHGLSCRFGAMKPEKKVYQEAARLAGVVPGEVFFTDDREENVAGAKEAGFDAVLFRGPGDLTRELLRRGVTANY